MKKLWYFLWKVCCGSRSSSPSRFTPARENRLARFTDRFETPQAEAARPRTSVTWIRLQFWRSSSETEVMISLLCAVNLPAISSSRTSFGVKMRERSKYLFVDITWHRRSIAWSFVGNKLSNFGRKCPKKCLPRFKNGALKLRLCHFVNRGPGILK